MTGIVKWGAGVSLTHPLARPQAVEPELVCDLGGVHGVLSHGQHTVCQIQAKDSSGTYRQILLVGEDEEGSIAQLILVQHALQLLTGLNNTIAIVAVNDEDNALCVLEVVPPQRTDLVLATDIPHGE